MAVYYNIPTVRETVSDMTKPPWGLVILHWYCPACSSLTWRNSILPELFRELTYWLSLNLSGKYRHRRRYCHVGNLSDKQLSNTVRTNCLQAHIQQYIRSKTSYVPSVLQARIRSDGISRFLCHHHNSSFSSGPLSPYGTSWSADFFTEFDGGVHRHRVIVTLLSTVDHGAVSYWHWMTPFAAYSAGVFPDDNTYTLRRGWPAFFVWWRQPF